MVARYRCYIITGFSPVYEQTHGMLLTTGLFRGENIDVAKRYYEDIYARLPVTKRLVEFDGNTALYFLKYNIDDLALMIRAKTYFDAVKAFDSFRCLGALVYHWYSDETNIITLEHKPSFTKTQLHDLAKLAGATDATMFELELHRGIQVTDQKILGIEKQLRNVFLHSNIRRALACFYQSQTIYYTHLVGSYVSSHSQPELIGASTEEYRQGNYQYQEMLHASLLVCYRGIEALYSKNFRTQDFKKSGRSKLESYMDAKLPNAPSRSRYQLRFYRQREKHPPRRKCIITMLGILFRARNRAAHGHHWLRRHRLETFGSDLADESKFFLGHLIIHTLGQQ